jgi:hypothetical protein
MRRSPWAAALVLLLFHASAAEARCVAVRLLARVADGAASHTEARMLSCPSRALSAGFPATIAWDDFAKTIVWPMPPSAEGESSGVFVVVDAALPAVRVEMHLKRREQPPMRGTQCHAVDVSIGGAVAPEDAGAEAAESLQSVRDISIAGEGEALLCGGETVPRAAALHLVRKVRPALWQRAALQEVRTSDIDVAWAALP